MPKNARPRWRRCCWLQNVTAPAMFAGIGVARASIFKMMDVSRHKSVDTLRGYVRDAELFKDHAGAGLL
jgi:hypothetical protein